MSKPIERPAGCDNEHLEYLDDLREGGQANMFAARAYLLEEFELTKSEAGEISSYWMATFGGER